MKSSIVVMALFAVLVSFFAFSAESPAEEETRISRPFEYSGYSTPQYRGAKTLSEYVSMPDGVRIAVDVHIPTDGPARDSFPVVFIYMPYQRSKIDPASGELRDHASSREGKFFLSHGYAVVVADMRGTGASTGWYMDFMPELAADGARVVDWIAAQSWCDGNVGMMGSSYLGWSQMAAASHAPEALKCIVPQCIPLDGYTGEAYPGGIFLQSFVLSFSGWMELITQNRYVPASGVYPTKPVVDEDGDGELADEIPVDVDGSGSFLDDAFPPVYMDGAKRDHVYYYASRGHMEANLDYGQWASVRPFIDTPTPLGFNMYDLSPGAFIQGVRDSKVAIYHIGGWFDAFTRGTTELYATMADSNPSRLVMAPSYHDFPSGPYWKHFGIDDPTSIYLTEHLRFFDRYLRGVDNGIDTEPPVTVFVMNGEGWRGENEWPLKRQEVKRLLFAPDNTLAVEPGEPGSDTYMADLSHNSSYTDRQGNRYVGIGGQTPTGPVVRGDKERQCLVYTSQALPDDTEVTGHPVVRFWASSTTPDADFFVYLEDVDAEGNAMLVTEGQLRAGFAALYDNNDMLPPALRGKIDVLPDLPWHGFEKAQYNGEVFSDGAVVELVIDYNPTSWLFKKGHRVRVSIACADYPTFRLHPTLSPKNSPAAEDNLVPVITLYRDSERPSCLEIPVVSAVR